MRQWKCTSILETSTWRTSLLPAFRIDYPSSTTPTIISNDVNSNGSHFVDICTIAVGPTTGTGFSNKMPPTLKINALFDTGASMSCMSLKTFESLHLTITKDRFPTVVTATGVSMDPVGFTQCTFSINGHSFTKKFIVCTNQTRPVILGKDFAARNCISMILTKQGSRKMIDDDNKVIMEVHEQTKDVPLSLANSIRIPPNSVVVAAGECNRPLQPHMDIRGDAGFLRDYPNIPCSSVPTSTPLMTQLLLIVYHSLLLT